MIISSLLAQKMGGNIELISEVGKGSSFFFSITTEYGHGKPAEYNEPLTVKRVLVVDDNDNNRTILEHNFAYWGIEYVGCDNGLTALKLLENSEPFDVMMIDYHMPYIDGLETIRMIKEKLHLPQEKMPIILLHSSSDSQELRDKCCSLDVKHLVKPVKASELYRFLVNIHKDLSTSKQKQKDADQAISISIHSNHPAILIAEDVDMNMMLAKSLIFEIIPNIEIIEAKNGLEVIELLKQKKVDLIFMDIQMPEQDGIETTKQIRKIEKNTSKHIPIIALTAGALKEEKEKCIASGMNDFLAKPIQFDSLSKILKKYLKNFPELDDRIEKLLLKKRILMSASIK